VSTNKEASEKDYKFSVHMVDGSIHKGEALIGHQMMQFKTGTVTIVINKDDGGQERKTVMVPDVAYTIENVPPRTHNTRTYHKSESENG